MPPGDLLHRAAEERHRVGRGKPHRGPEDEFALARPVFDFDRAQRQPERHHVAADQFERRLHEIVALLGQILIAMREQRNFRRLARLAGVLGGGAAILELEQMKLDFDSRLEVEAALRKLAEHRAHEAAGGERDRPAIGEIKIAQDPARARRPWQNLESGRIGNEQEVGRALHLRHPESAAGGEDRKDGSVRGVLGEKGGRRHAAVFERAQAIGRDQSLAAQNPVLVGKRESDRLEAALFDQFANPGCGVFLLLRPQSMSRNETQERLPGPTPPSIPRPTGAASWP